MTVLAECYPDVAVLVALGVARGQLRHERCKGEIVNRLKKLPDAIGVVDEDPASAQPRDLANSYHAVEAAEGLRLLVRQGKGGQRLIVLCPRREDWLLQRARSSGIKPEDYGLPRAPNHLHSIPRYERRDGFQRFLTGLASRDGGMNLLRQWVLQQANSTD
jgi:hypothetical protein